MKNKNNMDYYNFAVGYGYSIAGSDKAKRLQIPPYY